MRATTVTLRGRALLLAGPSGAGKSSLALELMSLGAGLVADDVTELTDENGLTARAPASLPEAIEARGLGILYADLVGPTAVFAAVDLTRCAAARMPQAQEISLLEHSIPLLHKPASGPVAAMLLQYLKQKMP